MLGWGGLARLGIVYLGEPLAIAEGKIFMASDDNTTSTSTVFALGLPARR